MGEVADMMLDGTLCEDCGVYIGGERDGIPRRCKSCRRDMAEKARGVPTKVKCPQCGRKVKAAGLADHRRDAHARNQEGENND